MSVHEWLYRVEEVPPNVPPIVAQVLEMRQKTACNLCMFVLDLDARVMWYAATQECSQLLGDRSQGCLRVRDVMGAGNLPPHPCSVPLSWVVAMQPCPLGPVDPTLPRTMTSTAISFGKRWRKLEESISQLPKQQWRVYIAAQQGSSEPVCLADAESYERMQNEPISERLRAALGSVKKTPLLSFEGMCTCPKHGYVKP